MSSKQDLIEIKEVISQCNELIKQQSQGWAKIVEEIKKVNSSAPSSYIKMQKEVAQSVINAEKAEQQYQKTLQQKQVLEQKILQTEKQKIQLSETARRANEAQEKALQRATQTALNNNSAYLKLQTNWRNAQRAYADLLSTVNASPQAIAKARNEFELLDKKIKQVDTATKNYSKNVGNYASGLKGFTSDLAGALGWAGAITTAISLGKEMYNVTKQLDSVNTMMRYASKDTFQLASNQQFLNRITEQYGLELISTSQAYTKFYSASKNKLALEDIQLIFEKISKSASLMGMSTDEQNGVFLALSQMMSKGTVQAEELRGQLGERLPQAMEAMAKAMGVSEAELGKLMEKGQVMSAEVLPKFAVELEKAMGADQVIRVENLNSAQVRLSNSWTEFVANINGSKNEIGTTMTFWFNQLSNLLGWIDRVSSSWNTLVGRAGQQGYQSGFNSAMNSNVSADEARKQAFELEKTQRIIAKRQKEVQAEFDRVNNRGLFGKSFTSLGSDRPLNTVGKDLENITKELERVNGEMIAYRNIANGINKQTEKPEYNVTPLGSTKKGKSAETLENERIRRLVDIAKQEQATAEASIKRQIAEADASIKIEESYLLQQNLAVKKYESGIKIADIELKNEEQKNDRKKELASELANDLIEIDDKYLKNKKDLNDKDFDAELKRLEEIRKTKKEEYGLLDLEYQIYFEKTKQTTFKNIKQELKYNEDLYNVKKQELDDWFEYQLDVTDEGSNERLKAEKEYQLKSIQLEKDKQDKLKALQDNFKKVMKDTALNMLGSLGGESLSQFFNGEFDKIWEGADTLGKKIQAVMKAIGDISADVLGQISSMQQANFEAQLSRLEQEKEVALKFAGDSSTGREAIERQYDEKRKEIQKKQAMDEKRMALLQIAINTAVGITAALPNIPLSIAVGVLGAIQAGIVASTPIPEFWTGTDNAPEGLALTQERGAEIIMDKNNRIKTLGNDKGAQLTYLNKGDKVLNASDTTDKINEMLMGSGISPIVKVENKGLTKAEMIDVMNQTLARQPRQTTKFDEKGVTLFIERENSRTIKRGNNARI